MNDKNEEALQKLEGRAFHAENTGAKALKQAHNRSRNGRVRQAGEEQLR